MLWLASVLSTQAGRAAGRALARAAMRFRPHERALAGANIALAYPGTEAAWQEQLVVTATDRLGDTLFDSLTVERWLSGGMNRINGDDARDQLQRCRAQGRGVLILTGHLGCWELLGGWLAQVMEGLTVIVGEIHNEPVDRLVNDRRRKTGLNPVPRDGDLRPLLRALRRGDAAAVLMDQATRVPSRPVPFFGTPAPTATGFASLAIRTGAPVLPVAIQRDGHGHRIVTGDVIDPTLFGGADPEFAFLQACNDALEDFVRRNPAEWVWFHKRWPDNTNDSS